MTLSITETADVAACIAIRVEVFVEEQGIPMEEEIDEFDGSAVHLMATKGDQPVGTARLIIKGETGKIGRVCVVKSQRGTGLGIELIETGIAYFARTEGVNRAYLSAQEYAVGFYEKLGFTAYGPLYDDAGIPHRDMERSL